MNKNLKIAIIGSRGYPYVYSGYETLVKELSERLVKKGYEIIVYCHASLFKERPAELNGIKLVYTPSIETKFLSQFINSFFSFIHVCFTDVDIVLTLNVANGPFGIFTKIFNKKTCINVDGLEWLRPKWKGLGSLYFKISAKLATCFYDEIITDSFEMYKIYKKTYNKNSHIIAYGSTMIDTNSTSILKKYNLNKSEYYLIVGRLVPDNNSKLILDGFKTSQSKKKIVIVGDVPYNDNYAKTIKSLSSNKIILTGYVKSQLELSSLFINCYAYIHGHEYGGTNPTMINALDLNCQILALNTPFNKEMLQNRKKMLFEKNKISINECIDNFEHNYNTLILENSDYKLPKKYNWDIICNNYINLFSNLVK